MSGSLFFLVAVRAAKVAFFGQKERKTAEFHSNKICGLWGYTSGSGTLCWLWSNSRPRFMEGGFFPKTHDDIF